MIPKSWYVPSYILPWSLNKKVESGLEPLQKHKMTWYFNRYERHTPRQCKVCLRFSRRGNLTTSFTAYHRSIVSKAGRSDRVSSAVCESALLQPSSPHEVRHPSYWSSSNTNRPHWWFMDSIEQVRTTSSVPVLPESIVDHLLSAPLWTFTLHYQNFWCPTYWGNNTGL